MVGKERSDRFPDEALLVVLREVAKRNWSAGQRKKLKEDSEYRAGKIAALKKGTLGLIAARERRMREKLGDDPATRLSQLLATGSSYKVGELLGIASTTVLEWVRYLGVSLRSQEEALRMWSASDEGRSVRRKIARSTWECEEVFERRHKGVKAKWDDPEFRARKLAQLPAAWEAWRQLSAQLPERRAFVDKARQSGALGLLDQQEMILIDGLYPEEGNPRRLQDIAHELGVNRRRLRPLEEEALSKLRQSTVNSIMGGDARTQGHSTTG